MWWLVAAACHLLLGPFVHPRHLLPRLLQQLAEGLGLGLKVWHYPVEGSELSLECYELIQEFLTGGAVSCHDVSVRI